MPTAYAIEYVLGRPRPPDEDRTGPKRTPSRRTLQEMAAGARASKMNYWAERMPFAVFKQLTEWELHWMRVSGELQDGDRIPQWNGVYPGG